MFISINNENNFIINKCENCGRLFIPITSSNNPNQKGRNDQKYCNNLFNIFIKVFT